MSIDTALQRMAEINAMTGAPAATSTSATAGASSVDAAAFAVQLQQAQSQLGILQGIDGDGDGQADGSDGSQLLTQSSLGGTVGTAGMLGSSSAYGSEVANVLASLGGSSGASATNPLASISGLGALSSTSGLSGVASLGGSSMVGGSVGQRMVALAQSQVGVRESPAGSNDSPMIRQYRTATAGAENTPGPWCAYFVSWLGKEAGAPVGPGGSGLGYVPSLEAWGRSTGTYFDGQLPQPGDIAIFAPGSVGLANHTGIVESVDPDGTIHTIEGNSSDAVTRHTYSLGGIKGFVRPG